MGCHMCTDEKPYNQMKRTIVGPTHHYRMNLITNYAALENMDSQKRE